MLRDREGAFEAFARFQQEQIEQVNANAPTENNAQGTQISDSDSAEESTPGDEFPAESLRQPGFEQIGKILYPFWYNVEHARLDVRKSQAEVRRWERSIAFLDKVDVPDVSESKILEEMLEMTCTMIKVENMVILRNGLAKMFEPLDRWAACVIRTKEQHAFVYYAIGQALFCITSAMVTASETELTEDQTKYVWECRDAAEAYVFFVEHRASLEEDERGISDQAESPLNTFPKLLRHGRLLDGPNAQ